MFPEIDVDTYWCSINQLPVKATITLYYDHDTSEQFHSEIKSDMGLECLPSGRFSRNSLILLLGILAYKMIRIIGQQSLEKADSVQLPGYRHKKVTRRRIPTVIQNLIYMAGRLIYTSRR